jgi:capsular exopolysaccharide synthesis family protein
VGVPLGSIIPRRLVTEPTLVVREAPRSPLAERYRSLMQRLFPEHLANRAARQIVTVTSAAPDEGKTTTVLNLALALAERKDHTTLLVDGDLRRPSVSRFLTPTPEIGLSDVLQGEARLEHALLQLKDVKLSILPAGTLVPNPQELLRSQYLAALFGDLRKQFDYVLIDTPPVVPFTDSSVFNALADGAVVVIRAGKTPGPLVERAFNSLSGGKILGVVLNAVQITAVDRYYYKYDDYDPDRYASPDRGGA